MRVNLENFVGKTYNKLTIISPIYGDKTNKYYHRFECICECGNKTIVGKSNLIRGHTTSCGCSLSSWAKEHIKKINISGIAHTKNAIEKRRTKTIKLEPVGTIFGRLTVVESYVAEPDDKKKVNRCICKCECGTNIDVPVNTLRTGHTKSCGCLHDDLFEKTAKNYLRKKRIEKGLSPDIPIQSENTRERALFVSTVGKETKERDNYTCYLCGIRGGWLESHHLTLWSKDKENRFNPKNIATLCRDCHINKVHRGSSQSDPDPELTNFLLEKIASKYE